MTVLAIIGMAALTIVGLWLIFLACVGALVSHGFSGKVESWLLVPGIIGALMLWSAVQLSPFHITIEVLK